jgi:hypothetical protein
MNRREFGERIEKTTKEWIQLPNWELHNLQLNLLLLRWLNKGTLISMILYEMHIIQYYGWKIPKMKLLGNLGMVGK